MPKILRYTSKSYDMHEPLKQCPGYINNVMLDMYSFGEKYIYKLPIKYTILEIELYTFEQIMKINFSLIHRERYNIKG